MDLSEVGRLKYYPSGKLVEIISAIGPLITRAADFNVHHSVEYFLLRTKQACEALLELREERERAIDERQRPWV